MPEAYCKLYLDDIVDESDEFIAVLGKPDGDVAVYFYADAMTLGMGLKMIARAFMNELSELSEEDRNEIEDILGDIYIGERIAMDLEVSDRNVVERVLKDE